MLMDLVVEARRQGVLIYVDAGNLKAKAIGDALTGELREKIRAHKSELIELLAVAQPRTLDDVRLQAQESYWLEALRAAPQVHEFPLDRPRGSEVCLETLGVDSWMSSELSADVDTLAGRLGKDRFHVLHAAFSALISRWSGRATVVIGSRLPQRLHPHGLGRELPRYEVLPISVEITVDATLASVLDRTSVALTDAHEHGDLPLLLIADLLKLERDTQHAPVLQLVFLEQASHLAGNDSAGLPARFDLAASVRALPHGGLALDWTFDRSLFEVETIQALTRSFAKLVESLVQHPDDALHAFDPVADDDWSRIEQWNSTGRDFDHAARLHDLFAAHVAATPDAIALVCADQRISYAALDAQARCLAAHLRSVGVGPDSVVAVCVPRTSELIVGILGVLMAGGAYLPIDPAYPQERIAYILHDSAARVLLTHSVRLPQMPEAGIATICLDRPDSFAASAPIAAVGRDTTADDLAYLIYTSGSTGKPKGVALEHRGAINLHANQVRHFGLSSSSRVLQFASIGFDAATWEWVMALLSGGTLFLCPDDRRASATALADYLVEQRITHATLPPALLAHLDPHRDYALEALIVAGEACPESLRELWAGRVPMFNGYGPSETTVCASVERLQADGRVSIGRPLDNVQTYVVDDRLRLSPIGAVGELMIGGVGLARGYVGNPHLTAERFIECSLRPGHRQRLYCSGDLVRYLPDGRLDFVGRKDDQIKLRGFRIEPREIEAILGAHALVGHATVVLRQTDRASSLAAYVVPATAMDVSARRALGDELLQHLAGQVPDYMVPATLTVVEAFPLTANGKIDKHALLALDVAGAGDDMVEARTEVERALERMWCELLKLERVGVHENFFAIGGDSILSIQAVARANQAGIPVTIRQLFEFTTIAGIAANLAESDPALEPASDASGEMPLMPMQARFLSEQTDAPHHFNQSILLDVPADMDDARLLAIAAALVARHDALRLAFPVGDDGRRHAIHQDLASYPIDETVRVETMDESHASFATFVRERSDAQQRGFCLDHAPLFRLVHLRGQGQSRLLLVAHHLVVDGVSWRILLQDLELAYAQLTLQQDIVLSAKPASYQQWATALSEYAGEAKLQEELPYWLEQAEAAPLAIAPDHVDAERPRQSSTRYASIELSEDQTRQLLRPCNEPYRTNINELLLASLYLGLQAFGESDRLQVAVEGHGREPLFSRLDGSQTVGWFTSVFPLNFRIESRDIGAAIKCIKEQYRRIPRGGVGYGVLRYMARDQALVHASRQEPQILFNYLGQFDSALGEQGTFRFADEDTGASGDGAHRRDYPLGINGLVSGGKPRFTVDYSDEEFRPETIERLAESFREGLSAVI
ncbi:MAG: amino acid adenylation domain-containing protein, partial [Lysobacter sp.]